MAEYIKHNGNGTKAALAAGYGSGDPAVAASQASENLRKPKVRKHLERLTRHFDMTPDRVLSRLDGLSVAAQEANNFAAAVRAEELIGKSLGMWVDRSVNVNLDLTGEHVAAIRALASRRQSKSGARAGDDALEVSADVSTAAQNDICHNADYTREHDKSVIDQRVNVDAPLKQSADDAE